MSISFISTLLTSFTIFFIGTIAYFHDRKSASNVLFYFISLSTIFWAIANYFSINVAPEKSLFWIRLVLFFAVPHAIFFWLFVNNFPKREITNKALFVVSFLILLITAGLALSPFIFSHITIADGVITPVPGKLMPIFSVVVFGSLISSLIVVARKYKAAADLERIQWRFLLIGTVMSYVLLILTNFVLVVFFQNTFFIPYGPLFMLPTFVGTGYAILKHHLLNVKTIASEILTFVILSISLVEIFSSRTTTETIFRIAIFAAFLIVGILLIRSVLREVEQREKMEALSHELAAANEELKQLDEAKSEFISLAGHQLRTPLTAIKGYASMVLEGSFGQITDSAHEALDRISRATGQLIKLTADLLDLSRIEAGKFKYKFENIDLDKLITNAVKELEENAKNKNITIEFHDENKGQCTINADFDKIHEVVINLVDNAIRYSEAGPIVVNLKLVNSNNIMKLLLAVKDKGIGIKAEDISKLFVKFGRSAEATKVRPDGMGLGLYFVRKIVEDHKGRVWVESEGIGKGSTFFAELPVS